MKVIIVLKSVILFGVDTMLLRLNTAKLKELLMDFYILTKIKIVLFDEEFNEILAYPEKPCDFCALIKENANAKMQCDKNDRHACNVCLSTKKLFMYKCHAGLIEVAAPIKVNDIILGYIMFGQIIDNKNKMEAKVQVLNQYI
jgi:ligand-binding sensor protein